MAAELAHTMHVAQQIADLEAGRIATLARAKERDVAKVSAAKAADEARHAHLRAELELVQSRLAAAGSPVLTGGLPMPSEAASCMEASA